MDQDKGDYSKSTEAPHYWTGDRGVATGGNVRSPASRGETSTAIQLLKDALFLRQNGERPPGAPHDDPDAETWREWDTRAEAFLRGFDG